MSEKPPKNRPGMCPAPLRPHRGRATCLAAHPPAWWRALDESACQRNRPRTARACALHHGGLIEAAPPAWRRAPLTRWRALDESACQRNRPRTARACALHQCDLIEAAPPAWRRTHLPGGALSTRAHVRETAQEPPRHVPCTTAASSRPRHLLGGAPTCLVARSRRERMSEKPPKNRPGMCPAPLRPHRGRATCLAARPPAWWRALDESACQRNRPRTARACALHHCGLIVAAPPA